MNIDIGPWKSGDRGYACMPLAANLPDTEELQARHPEWRLVQCPVCGEDCWESEAVRQMNPEEVRGVCTLCAVKIGISNASEPTLIRTWEELAKCISDTHEITVDVDGCNGWIKRKNSDDSGDDYFDNNHYLSTHTFYGNNYKGSTILLQKCGFNVRLENWDGETAPFEEIMKESERHNDGNEINEIKTSSTIAVSGNAYIPRRLNRAERRAQRFKKGNR